MLAVSCRVSTATSWWSSYEAADSDMDWAANTSADRSAHDGFSACKPPERKRRGLAAARTLCMRRR